MVDRIDTIETVIAGLLSSGGQRSGPVGSIVAPSPRAEVPGEPIEERPETAPEIPEHDPTHVPDDAPDIEPPDDPVEPDVGPDAPDEAAAAAERRRVLVDLGVL
jgi:hypothetical protein